MHIRKRLRDAVVIALTGLPQTASRVFVNRRDPLTAGELPAIRVMTPDSALGSIALTIEALAAIDGETEALADWLDEIALSIEAALAADVTLGGVITDLRLASSALIVDNEGEMAVAVMSMQYLAAADLTGEAGMIKVEGAVLGRLRGFTLSMTASPADVSNSGSMWTEVSPKVRGAWSAVAEMRRDPADAPQNALIFKSVHSFEFFPSGLSAASHAGSGVVSGIDDVAGGDGETIRTVTITGAGALS